MKSANLKSKLNKMNVNFSDENSTISFELNNKKYEANITISGEICNYNTANYSKFEGRTFDTFNQIIRHSQK